MHHLIRFGTRQAQELVDITERVRAVVRDSGVRNGLVNLYAQGATAAIMIQENWDDSVPLDVVDLLRRLIPPGVWRHDQQDGNAHPNHVLVWLNHFAQFNEPKGQLIVLQLVPSFAFHNGIP